MGGSGAAAAAKDAGRGGGGAEECVGPRSGRHNVAGESGRGGEESCCGRDGEGCGKGKAVQSGNGGGVGGKERIEVGDTFAREHGPGAADRRGNYQRKVAAVAADDFMDDAGMGGRHDSFGEKTVGHSAVEKCLDNLGIIVEDVGSGGGLRGAYGGGNERGTGLAGGIDGGTDGVAARGGE